jgi:GT2 family glycosyltransferase
VASRVKAGPASEGSPRFLEGGTSGAPTRGVIDAVILTSSSREQVLTCLLHLDASPAIGSVVVVDNASTDGTASAIRAAWPQVVVVRLETHTGLAAALNRGAETGDSAFVLYLNDDIFAVPGAIERLLSELERHPDAVSAAGRLVNDDLTTQDRYRPRAFPSPAAMVARLFGLDRLWPRNPWTGNHLRHPLDDGGTVEVEQPAGACLLVRRRIVEQVNGWDERYSFWYEDVDFLRRIAEHGSSLYVPSAAFRHIGAPTVTRWSLAEMHERMFNGIVLYSRAHFSRRGQLAVVVALAVVSLARAARAVVSDRPSARIYGSAAVRAFALAWGDSGSTG